LTNILIVVVRYFGGTKLGVSGLIQAYKIAAEECLKNATTVEVDVTNTITIQYDYTATPEVMKLVKDFDLTIKDQSFEERSLLKAEFKIAAEEQLLERLSLTKSMGVKIDWKF
jgi:putative IMPACT (imprinted ancient) family translation regulator